MSRVRKSVATITPPGAQTPAPSKRARAAAPQDNRRELDDGRINPNSGYFTGASLNKRLNKPALASTAVAGGEVKGAANLRVQFANAPAGMRMGFKTSGDLFRTVELDRGRAMQKSA